MAPALPRLGEHAARVTQGHRAVAGQSWKSACRAGTKRQPACLAGTRRTASSAPEANDEHLDVPLFRHPLWPPAMGTVPACGPVTACPNRHAALSNTLSLLKYAIPLVSIVACCYFDAGQLDVQQAICLVCVPWPVG